MKINKPTNHKPEEQIFFKFRNAGGTEKIIYLALLAVAGLHILGIFIKSPYLWGFNYIGFLHPALQGFFTLFTVFIFLPQGQILISKIFRNLSGIKEKIPGWAGYLLIILAAMVIFWLLRVKVFVLGDASLMFQTANLEDTETWTNREMLTTRVVAFINDLLKSTGQASIINAFVIVSFISGMIFVLSVLEIARLLGRNNNEKFLVFFFLIFSTCSLLFFGYVENYPILYAFMALYFLFSLKYLYGKCSIFYSMIFYTIVFLLHMGAMALFPTLIYLLYYEFKKKKNYKNIIIAGIIFIITLSVLLVISGKGFIKIINIFSQGWSLISGNAVPIKTPHDDFAVYSMFSFWHIVDFINHQILLNPLAILFIGIFILKQKKNINWSEPVVIFLLLASLFAIGMEFTINHIYGMSKDWDVMAPYVIAFALLCLYLLNNMLNLINGRIWIVTLITGVLFLHTIPYILVYSTEEPAIERSLSLQNSDIMPKIGIIVTAMNIGDYFRLNQEYNKAYKYYYSLVEKYPNDARGYLLTARILDKEMKNFNRALEITRTAVDRGIRSKKLISNLGQFYYQTGNYDESLHYWRYLVNIDTAYYKVFGSLGYVYALKGKYDSALIYLEKAQKLDTINTGIYQNLGNCYLATGNFERSIYNYEKSLQVDKISAAVLKNLGLCYLNIGNKAMAKKYWSKYLEVAKRNEEYELIKRKVEELGAD